MDFFVNGQKVDITLEDEKTIGDILEAAEKNFAQNDATTIGITLNGEKIPADGIEETSNLPITPDTKLELEVLSKSELIESLKSIKERFKRLAKVLPDIPLQFQSGKAHEANSRIAGLAESLEEFCHLITLSYLFPDVKERLVFDGKNTEDFFKDFTPVISDFEQALESEDTVTSGDLCEYEIAPRLEKIVDGIERGLCREG